MYANVVALGIDGAQRYLQRVDKFVSEENEARVKKATIRLQGQIKREASGGTVGGPLSRDRGPKPASGKLAQSFTVGFERTAREFVGRTGSSLIYARIHEGPQSGSETIVTAKRAKYLTIPLTEKAARRPARSMDLEVVPLVGGGLVLIDASTGEPHYLLKRSVRIPARRYITKAVGVVKPEIDASLSVSVDAALRKADS